MIIINKDDQVNLVSSSSSSLEIKLLSIYSSLYWMSSLEKKGKENEKIKIKSLFEKHFIA